MSASKKDSKPPARRTPSKRPPARRASSGSKDRRDTAARRRPSTRTRATRRRPVTFVTGYPGFIGRRLVRALVQRRPSAKVILLVQEKFEKDARAEVGALCRGKRHAEVEILVGDIVDMDLGLSGEEIRRLLSEVTSVFHLAAITYLGVHERRIRRVNVGGTRRMLEVAREMERLERFNYMSTAWVCGDRQGVILEDELEMGQRFRNPYEETKYEAEILVRDAMRDLPITIYRPSIVVGDSKTGEIDRFDGPYYLGILLVTSPLAVPLPLPGNGIAPLNVVPVDYVVDAILAVDGDQRGVGRTLHLVDPNPLSSRRVYEEIARMAGKRLPRVTLSFKLTDALMRLPGLERLIRQQRQAVQYVNQLVLFNSANTLELLDGTGVRCPPLPAYLERVVSYVREYYRHRPSADPDEVDDPLDA